MEEKLLDLKEQFCRWHCHSRDTEIEDEQTIDVWCKACECDIPHTQKINFGRACEYCQVGEYIRFIRDDI